jgi:hypothetical protein
VELKDMKFDELVDKFAAQALSHLLMGGGPGLHGAIYQAMMGSIQWRQELDAAQEAAQPTDTQIAEVAYELVKGWMNTDSRDTGWVDLAAEDLISRCKLSYGATEITMSVARTFVRSAEKRFYEVLEENLNPE